MKKLLAITLLIVHLFNLAGYPFLFRYFIKQSSQQLTQKIDNHSYKDSELIEIKVALNLPYITASSDYQRLDGEITINGKHHNYVKRKVSEDTLYLLCLPNKQKDKLQLAKSDYGKIVNDFDDKENESAVKKSNIFNQYHQVLSEYSFTSPNKLLVSQFSFYSFFFPDSYTGQDGKPPQLNS